VYSTNYNIKKELLFYPLNKIDSLTISLSNSRLVSKKTRCKICNSDTCYDCEHCDLRISETYRSVPRTVLKKLPIIEEQIIAELKEYKSTCSKLCKNKDEAIQLIQKVILNKKFNNKTLAQLIDINSNYGNGNEISYYISKTLYHFDNKLIFLLKLYEYIVSLATGAMNPYGLFYYKNFKKYEFLIKDFEIDLLITKEEFREFYQNVPEYVGSLLNFYSPDKKYPKTIITNKEYECDINFETAAKCRQEDNKLFFINLNLEEKMIRKTRDQIRSEFRLKKVKKPKVPCLPKIEIGLKLINCN
jgi:hypothetical protein